MLQDMSKRGERSVRGLVLIVILGTLFLGSTFSQSAIASSGIGHTAGITAPGGTRYPEGGLRLLDTLFGEGVFAVATTLHDGQRDALYFGTTTNPGQVAKFDLTTMSHGGTITFPPGVDWIFCGVADVERGFAYFGTSEGAPTVLKVDLETFSWVDSLAMEEGDPPLVEAILDPAANTAYFVARRSNDTTTRIFRIDLDTLTRTGDIELATGNTYLAPVAIDQESRTAVFRTLTRLYRIDLETFALVEEMDLEAALPPADPKSAAAEQEAQHLRHFVINGEIKTVDLVGFQVVEIHPTPLENSLWSFEVDDANGWAYYRRGGTPAEIVKVSFPAFVEQGVVTFESWERNVWNPVFDFEGGKAYASTYTDPTHVIVIDLDAFVREDLASLAHGQNYFHSGAVDPDDRVAYLGGWGWHGQTMDQNPGQIVKVDLEAFEIVDALMLEEGEEEIADVALHQEGSALYVALLGAPGKLVKVDLETLTRVDAIDLDSDQWDPESILIDPRDGGTAYIHVISGVVVLDLSTFEVVDFIDLPSLNTYNVGAIDLSRDAAYFARNDTLYRMNLTTRATTVTLPMQQGDGLVRTMAIHLAENFAYLGTSEGKHIKVDLATGTRTDEMVIDAGSVTSILIDEEEEMAFVGGADMPGKLVLIDLALFSQMGWQPIHHGNFHPAPISAGIDPLTRNAIFGTWSAPGRVLKVTTERDQAVNATRLVLEEGASVTSMHFHSHAAEGNVRLSIYDNGVPRRLLWESGAIANTAEGEELVVPIAEGTPSSLVLLEGTYWLAWQTDTRTRVGSYTAGDAEDGFFLHHPFDSAPETIGHKWVSPAGEMWTQYITYDVYTQDVWMLK